MVSCCAHSPSLARLSHRGRRLKRQPIRPQPFGGDVGGAAFFSSGLPPPVGALTAELANKCREIAIKAPLRLRRPEPGRAERDFFAGCVAKEGKMQDDDAPPPRHETPLIHFSKARPRETLLPTLYRFASAVLPWPL
jgi:hypothetical protein